MHGLVIPIAKLHTYGFSIEVLEVLLKVHRQIPEKRCFEKYHSCDQVCHFSAL